MRKPGFVSFLFADGLALTQRANSGIPEHSHTYPGLNAGAFSGRPAARAIEHRAIEAALGNPSVNIGKMYQAMEPEITPSMPFRNNEQDR